MNITRNQWFAIAGVILSALMTSTAFLTDTFGATMAKEVVGIAGFINMILNGIVVILTGQGQQIRDVAAMPGVTRIAVNDQATQTLAQLATDAAQPKVGAVTPDVRSALQDIAKGA